MARPIALMALNTLDDESQVSAEFSNQFPRSRDRKTRNGGFGESGRVGSL